MQITTSGPLLGQLPHMSRSNCANAINMRLGSYWPMEITRETQLAEIDAGIKRLGITQHKLENEAKVLVGTIKDLRRRGKRPLDAAKWERIKSVLSRGIRQEAIYTA